MHICKQPGRCIQQRCIKTQCLTTSSASTLKRSSPLADKDSPAIVMHSTSKDLAGTGRLLVDQHCKGSLSEGRTTRQQGLVPDVAPPFSHHHSGSICSTNARSRLLSYSSLFTPQDPVFPLFHSKIRSLCPPPDRTTLQHCWCSQQQSDSSQRTEVKQRRQLH